MFYHFVGELEGEWGEEEKGLNSTLMLSEGGGGISPLNSLDKTLTV